MQHDGTVFDQKIAQFRQQCVVFMKTVMIVDNDPIMIEIVASLLRDHGVFFRIIKVESSTKALTLIKKVAVDLVIVGLRVPEEDNIGLIKKLKKSYPKIIRVVLTDVLSPTLKTKIDQLGVSAYVEEPINMDALTELLLAELKIAYGGRIRGISLSSFTQMLELEGNSCVLRIRGNRETGELFFREGELIAANLGEQSGKKAALEILGWSKMLIDIDFESFEKKREIHIPLMSLLLESHKAEDERQVKKAEMREYPRYDCHINVEFDISDWSYEGVITDISLGGVYIESQHPVSVGSEIMLALTSLDDWRHCTIKGTVVRRDTKGVGVVFQSLSLYQQQVVQSYLKSDLGKPGG
jgi:CheY-like chemotaxis protein